MKKLMILALLVLGTSVAVAGDSEPLKAILKAKTYSEAENLVKTSLSQLANNEEKAAAYNKLVDLAMEKVTKEQAILNANQVAVQMKQGREEPFDTLGFYSSIYKAINNGIECEKYDVMPNEKGKVKPKFHKANQDRLYNYRLQLINGGQTAAQKNDMKTALENYGLYVDTSNTPLFAEIQKTKARDEYLGEVARVASVYAFQDKNIDLANKYCDVALQDTASYKDAIGLKMYIMQQGLKTKADSVRVLDQFKELYKTQTGDEVFGALASMYSNLGYKDDMNKLISEKLSQNPNCYTAWILKGQEEMNSSKWDDAINSYKKAVTINDKEPLVFTYLGFSINSKAGLDSTAPTDRKTLYTESLGYLEKARDLDPNREKANWTYPLYQCYYSLYGATDSRTKELESMLK